MGLSHQINHGCSRCGCKCGSCANFVLEKISSTCHSKEAEFKIHGNSTCTTKNVTYILYCKQYNKRSVGFLLNRNFDL